MVEEKISNYFHDSSKVVNSLSNDIDKINTICDVIKECFSNNKKILIGGNGGSAADAQHFAGELTCTYKNPSRRAFNAINLANNSSAITAWLNDFNHLDFFSRQVEAYGVEGDILFLISTGGGDLDKKLSINLINAANTAIHKKLKVVSLIGKTGGELEKISDSFVKVKSNITSHIQEAHISIIHYICESLEDFK
jgi:D-sedoheptulose 7-phosphate isomerase